MSELQALPWIATRPAQAKGITLDRDTDIYTGVLHLLIFHELTGFGHLCGAFAISRPGVVP